MDWISASLVMYIASVGLYLALRKLQKNDVPGIVNNTLMFGVGAIVFSLMALVRSENIALNPNMIIIMLVTTFLFSYLGNRFSLEGIRLAENPGFSLIIQKSYAIYTSFAAIFLFNSELSTKNLAAIGIVVIFMVVMLWQRNSSKNAANKSWIVYSFLSFFAFGNLALVSKWLLNEGVSPFARSFYVQLFVALMFLFDMIITLRKKPEEKKHLLAKQNYIWFFLIGLFNAIFNLFMQFAFQLSPNVGYVNIINAASIAAITILSAVLYKEALTTRKVLGVLGITIGIVILLL